jgi:DNA polymerase III, chi subunit
MPVCGRWCLHHHPLVRELDQALWTFSQEDFISHAVTTDSVAMQERSTVVLAAEECDVGLRQVLVNCLPEVPSSFAKYEKVVEIVGTDDDDRAWARQRWKQYTQQGFELIRHDVAQLQRGGA